MGKVRGGGGGKRHTASKWSSCQLLTCKGSYCSLLNLHVSSLENGISGNICFTGLFQGFSSVSSVGQLGLTL